MSACIQAEAVDLPKVVEHIVCISSTGPKAEALQVKHMRHADNINLTLLAHSPHVELLGGANLGHE